MKNKCTKKGCNPLEGGCLEGEPEFENCSYWNTEPTETIDTNEELPSIEPDSTLKIAWHGNSFGTESIHLIGNRNPPIVIGVIGLVSSGKTTFLAMIYLLLARGKPLESYSFNGSYTLNGWEIISHPLRWNKNDTFSFPARTTSEISRETGFLHFALRDKRTKRVRDIVFTDVPGEWFSSWMENSNAPNAEGGKYVIDKSDGFLFLLDCEGLSGGERGIVKKNIELLAKKLSNYIGEKPIGFLWAKSDKKEERLDKVKEKLRKKLDNSFEEPKFFDISYKEEKDRRFHENILGSVDWVLEEILKVPVMEMDFEEKESTDYFFKIKNV